MPLTFAPPSADTVPLFIVPADQLDPWQGTLATMQQAWAKSQGFAGKLGTICTLPNADGTIAAVAVGWGTPDQRARTRFHLGSVRAKLPEGVYTIQSAPEDIDMAQEALGWLLAGYRFARYRTAPPPKAQLVAPDGIDAARIQVIAAGEALTRDLINTPASDMGPDALEAAFFELGTRHGATCSATRGGDLIEQNFPMIHAVGRASDQAPRLLDMRWGDAGPKLTLVGKGVCFDTGGLNLKPGASMGLMKKDMGGAATVLGLAHMIMALNLPLQLRVLVPAVENSVSAGAFRPQDILPSRKGLTVEINNTDAEGRLVLADALALADEEESDLIVSMATLTGAARVAVGPDLAPFFTDHTAAATALSASGVSVGDPVWQLPLHKGYEAMIEPGIADLDNAPKGGFAGAITAALFLRRFVDRGPYVHFDIYGWQPAAAPARPKGGVGQGARALLDALPGLLKL